MKCKHCGAEIESGSLYCAKCGREVQIVPDYNPLEEVLVAQVRDGIDGATGPLNQNQSRNTGRTRHTSSEDIEARKRRAAQKKARMRRKKQKRLLVILSMLLVVILLCFLGYKNSYSGRVSSGYHALQKQIYDKAGSVFKKAITKKEDRPEAYIGLSKVYLAQKNHEKAENMFLTAIKKHPNNSALYQATFDFYIETKQEDKISPIIDSCSHKEVLRTLNDYVSKQPQYSLPEETFDDVQQLKLSCKGNIIYYTMDGSDVSSSSTKYTEPIQLGEGITDIKAISINKKGIPSLQVERKFTVELPIEDSPSVTPSTGQYEQAMQIAINVPEGYEAYYTMDNTAPTTSSTKYAGPIDMPEGNTIFCAVLVNGKGKMSDVTKRNYDFLTTE
ncbi:MAG: chitobiase/beta-hexosaminidase C-terminal domain-containing protein [Lachnospiraceae bacterium]